jgi:hypothetical protein
MRSAVRLVTVLVLVLSLGLHWALLQTVAWTGMIVGYSLEGSFSEALSKTFDGKHPCCVCKMIQQGRATEKKPDPQQAKTGMKLELGLMWHPTVLILGLDRERVPFADCNAASRPEEPPKPPPRAPTFNALG